MIRLNLQFFGGRGASGTMKNANGKVIAKKADKITAIRVNANGSILTYRDMGKERITDITGYDLKDTNGMNIAELAERAKSMGYEVTAYTAKEVSEMDAKRKAQKEADAGVDYELGYGLPWGNKQYRKVARRNRLMTRMQKRRR